MTVAAAEAALFRRALPLAAADLALTLGFKMDKVKFHLEACPLVGGEGVRVVTLINPVSYKHYYPNSRRYRYRRHGAPWSQALAPIEGGREALEAIIGPVKAFEPMPEPVVEPVPEPVSAVVGGVHFQATAEIVVLPTPVRGRRRAMWVDSPLRDFMLAVPVLATG